MRSRLRVPSPPARFVSTVAATVLSLVVVPFALPSAVGGQPPSRSLWHLLSAAAVDGVRTYRLDVSALAARLASAPAEDAQATQTGLTIMIPIDNGTFERFRVVRSSIVEPALAAQLSDIATYAGWAVDDSDVTLRCDVTPAGFSANVVFNDRTDFITPCPSAGTDAYACYETGRADHQERRLPYAVDDARRSIETALGTSRRQPDTVGARERTVRLAATATRAYVSRAGGTSEGALAEIVMTIDAVDNYLERARGTRLVLADDELSLIDADGAEIRANGPDRTDNPANALVEYSFDVPDAPAGKTDGPPCSSSVTPLQFGSQVGHSGALSITDCYGTRPGCYHDDFWFIADMHFNYEIFVASWEFSPDIVVKDAYDNVLMSTGAPGEDFPACTFYPLANTFYQVEVTSTLPGATGNYDLSVFRHQTYLHDEFETGAPGWTVLTFNHGSAWGLETVTIAGIPMGHYFKMPIHALAPVGQDPVYANNSTTYLTSPIFSISPNNPLVIRFLCKFHTELNYDRMRVSVSTDGGLSWTLLANYTGDSPDVPPWTEEQVGPTTLPGSANCRLRFEFESDSSVQDWGVAVDSVRIGAFFGIDA